MPKDNSVASRIYDVQGSFEHRSSDRLHEISVHLRWHSQADASGAWRPRTKPGNPGPSGEE